MKKNQADGPPGGLVLKLKDALGAILPDNPVTFRENSCKHYNYE